MNELQDMLDATNSQLPESYKILQHDGESFKLIRINAIESEDGIEDQWVATIFDMADFVGLLSAYAQKETE